MKLLSPPLLLALTLVSAMVQCTAPDAHDGSEPEIVDPPAQRGDRMVVPLEVEFYGCLEVQKGPLCILDAEAEFRLWVPAAPDREIDLRLDGKPIEAAREAREDGVLLRVNLAPPAQRLEVAVDRVTGERAEFSLTLQTSPKTPRPEFIAAWEFVHTQSHDSERAFHHRGILEDLLSQLNAGDRVECLRLLARLATRLEEPQVAVREYRQAVDLALKFGMIGKASQDALAASFLLSNRLDDLVEAERWLDRQSQISRGDPYTHALAPYFQGLLAYNQGDLERALQEFSLAGYRARRLDLQSELRQALQMHGLVLSRLGRDDEARALFEQAVALTSETTTPCARAELMTNIAASHMRTLQEGRTGEDPTPFLKQALALNLDPKGCNNPPMADRARLELAWVALLHGDLQMAQNRIEQVPAARLRDPSDRAMRLRLLTWLALARGEAKQALEHLEARRPLEPATPHARWQLDFDSGRAYELAGEFEAALDAYAKAELVVDDLILKVGFGDGRDLFATGHHESARHYIDLLVRERRYDEAFCAARIARARIVYPIDRAGRLAALAPEARAQWDALIGDYRTIRDRLDQERAEDWKLPAKQLKRIQTQRAHREERASDLLRRALALLSRASLPRVSCDDLRPPASDEAIVLYHPVRDGAWVGFAATAGNLQVHRFESLPETSELSQTDSLALGSTLLAPFQTAIGRAKHLRMLPMRALLDIPFHAASDPARPSQQVLERVDVAYAIDRPAKRTATDGELTQALVVADPRSNLAHANAEVTMVEQALGGRGVAVQTLRGAGASGARLRSALAKTDLLHYAGHGLSDGTTGVGSVLLLAGGTLSVGDILMLPRVPKSVVLSGCETGLTDNRTLSGGMSVAWAFVAAGSQSVIAASTEIDDDLGAAISSQLYSGDGAAFEGPVALQRAQLAIRNQSSEAPWYVFRAWVP